MSAKRRSKYPAQLRRFVDTVERRARSAGQSDAHARVYGAWAACFVRYCTVRSQSWQDPGHVSGFLAYLRDQQQVEASSRRRAAESMAFLFQHLLQTDVQHADWYPSASPAEANSAPPSSSRPSDPSATASDGGSDGASASPSARSDAKPAQRNATAEASRSTSRSASGSDSTATRSTSDDASAGDGAAGDGAAAHAENDATRAEQSSLLTRLLFHTSLPIHEALDLRAGDVDLSAGLIYVSDSLGTPKRVVELPDALQEPLRRHVDRVQRDHGARSFDAPLFQANALRGRVNDDADASDAASDTGSDTPSDAGSDDGDPSDAAPTSPDADRADRGNRSLWGYAT